MAGSLPMSERAVLASRTGDPRDPHLALQATWVSPASNTLVAMESVNFPYRKQIVTLTLLIFPSAGLPAVHDLETGYPNRVFSLLLAKRPTLLILSTMWYTSTTRHSTRQGFEGPLIDSHPLAARWKALHSSVKVPTETWCPRS